MIRRLPLRQNLSLSWQPPLKEKKLHDTIYKYIYEKRIKVWCMTQPFKIFALVQDVTSYIKFGVV